MSERFNIFFQKGFFKILDSKERTKFQNYCDRHKGKFGKMEIEPGIDEPNNQLNHWDKGEEGKLNDL